MHKQQTVNNYLLAYLEGNIEGTTNASRE